MAREPDRSRGLGSPGATSPGGVVLFSNRSEGPDVANVRDALRPLVELCLAPGAETPFALGLVGGRGAGKSFALNRLIEGVESLARAAGRSGGGAFLSKIVIARVDALAMGGDPASAIAAAVFSELERERDGANYTQLADEAAHATGDPRQAASVAAERHDETVRRLEQERAARDEVEGRRARIVETLLYESPGSRVDTFARSSRAKIEARLRGFGFVEGDAGANYRSLVRDLTGLGSGGRVGVFLRAIWSYSGQAALLLLAVLAFALAFLLNWLRSPGSADALTALSAQFAPALDWVKTHDELLEYTTEGLVVLAFASLFANLWRAASFTSLLFRGLRLLNLDIRERRRELDASAARLERRVAALQVEADAASQRAESFARRAGAGGSAPARPPGPTFVRPTEASAMAAREFMRELSRGMSAGATPAPQRLLLVIDNVDLVPLAEARNLMNVAAHLIGPGAAAIVAFDPSRLGDAAAEFVENLFEVVYDVTAIGGPQSLAATLLAPPAPAAALLGEADASKSALAEPLDEEEAQLLKSLSPLVDANPRTLKRYFNAYRLARLGPAPRPAIAVCLAALLSRDRSLAPALRGALSSEGADLSAASLPAPLASAIETAGLPALDRTAAQAAFEVARRYAPWKD